MDETKGTFSTTVNSNNSQYTTSDHGDDSGFGSNNMNNYLSNLADNYNDDDDDSSENNSSENNYNNTMSTTTTTTATNNNNNNGNGNDNGNGDDAMQALLASYYGLDTSKAQKREMEIDSSDFDAMKYVKKLLMEKDMKDLLQRDDDFVIEIKRLDSDMQMLVYENYSKFINATDTIRKMKNNVNDMKSEMDLLVTNMSEISTCSETVNGYLAEKRGKVDKLVRVRRLLKRLEFLFDLPNRLTRYIEDTHEYEKAVVCYGIAINILKQHSSITSFHNIKMESESIVLKLKDLLMNKLQLAGNPNANVNANVQENRLTIADIELYVGLLEQLEIPITDLQVITVKALKTHFNNLFQQIEQEITNNNNDNNNTTVNNLFNKFQIIDDQIFTQLELCVDAYKRLFLQQQQQDDSGSGSNNNNNIYNDIVILIESISDRIFAIVKGCLQNYLKYIYDIHQQETKKKEDDKNDGKEEEEGNNNNNNVGKVDLESCIIALNTIVNAVQRVDKDLEIREAELMTSCNMIVNDFVDDLILLEFGHLQNDSLQYLIKLYDIVTSHTIDDNHNKNKKKSYYETLSFREEIQHSMDFLITEMEKRLQILAPLIPVSYGECIPASAMRENLLNFICWFCDSMLKFCNVTTSLGKNDVYDIIDDDFTNEKPFYGEDYEFYNILSKSIILQNFNGIDLNMIQANFNTNDIPPKYVLILACLCRECNLQLVPKMEKLLDRYQINGYDISQSHSLDFITDCISAKADRLVNHYVELQGGNISVDISNKINSFFSSTSIFEENACLFADSILVQIDMISQEVGNALGIHIGGLSPKNNSRNESGLSYKKTGNKTVRGSVHLNIERLFTMKMKIFEKVEFNYDSIALGICKIVLKTAVETVRPYIIDEKHYNQLSVDVELLRLILPYFVKDMVQVENLLEEFLISIGDRCVEIEEDNAQGQNQIAKMIEDEENRMQSTLRIFKM